MRHVTLYMLFNCVMKMSHGPLMHEACHCIYIYTYIHMYMCMCIYIYMYIYTYIDVYVYIYMFIYTCIHIYTHMYIHIYINMHIYICIYLYIYISIYTYIYVYIYIHTYTFSLRNTFSETKMMPSMSSCLYMYICIHIHMYMYIYIAKHLQNSAHSLRDLDDGISVVLLVLLRISVRMHNPRCQTSLCYGAHSKCVFSHPTSVSSCSSSSGHLCVCMI